MAGRDLNYRITVDAAAGTAGIRDFSRAVNRELRSVDQSLDETGNNASRVARALGDMADTAETELRAAARAADALGTALGPELAARMGQDGIAEKVGDLTRLGLTFEEIEADADQLAAAIKRIDAVQVSAVDQGLGNINGKLRTAREEADQSRSVLANMVGNSSQTFAQFGGVVGDLGVGLGQLGEYATEGTINLKGLTSIVGPMAALGIATAFVSKSLKDAAEIRAFNADQVKAYSEAIRDGADAASVLRRQLEETGKLEFKSATFLGPLADSTWSDDVSDNLVQAGMSLEQFQRLIEGGAAIEDEWITRMKAAGVADGVLTDILHAATIARQNQADATEAARINEALLGDGTADLAVKLSELGRVIETTTSATETMADRADRLARRWDNLKGTLSERSAFLDIQDAFDNVETAAVEAWDAAAAGAVDAEQKARAHEQAVIDLKQRVADYAVEVGGISPQQVTEIYADIDRGSFVAAERSLDQLEEDRHVSIFTKVFGPGAGVLGTSLGRATTSTVAPAGRAGLRAVPAVDAPAPAAAAAPSSISLDVGVPFAAPVTVDMRGAILGSRYDVVRTVREAVRDGVRLAGSRS